MFEGAIWKVGLPQIPFFLTALTRMYFGILERRRKYIIQVLSFTAYLEFHAFRFYYSQRENDDEHFKIDVICLFYLKSIMKDILPSLLLVLHEISYVRLGLSCFTNLNTVCIHVIHLTCATAAVLQNVTENVRSILFEF